MKKLIVLLGVACASLSALFVRWSTAPALILVLYRMIIVSVLLAPSTLLHHRDELKQLTRRDLALCLISGAFLGMHFTAYFTAVNATSIASAVVLVNTEALFVALGSVLLLHQRLSGKAWLSILVAFGGSVILSMADTGSGAGTLRGDLIALAGALFMAVYTMIGAVCRRRISTTVYTFLVYLASMVTVLMVTLFCRLPLTGYAPINYLMALCLAVFCTLLGHSLFSWGLKYLPAALISTMKLLGAVFSSLLGLLFGEIPGVLTIVGSLIVLGGIGIYNNVDKLESKTEVEPEGQPEPAEKC